MAMQWQPSPSLEEQVRSANRPATSRRAAARQANRTPRRTVGRLRDSAAATAAAEAQVDVDDPRRIWPVCVAAPLLLLAATQAVGFDLGAAWAAGVAAPAVVVFGVWLSRRLAAREADPSIARIVRWSWLVKVAGGAARYLALRTVFHGIGDAVSYDTIGTAYAEAYRHLHFAMTANPGDVGTHDTQVLTGVIYSVTGSSMVAGFAVCTLVSWIGLWCFHRAFAIAEPDGLRRRYALLVFGLPTLLFWPSSLGKDGPIGVSIGVTILGAALLLRRRRGGLVLILAGLLGCTAIRSHIAVIAAATVVVVLLRRRGEGKRFNRAGKVAALVPLLLVGVVVLGQARQLLQLDRAGNDDLSGVSAEVQRRTGEGGSAFHNVAVTSPIGLPLATVTVLFRPLPFEASTPLSLALSVETTAVLGYCLVRSRSVVRGLARTLTDPYLAGLLASTGLFIVAFSTIGNFGILARQRAQILPLVLVFVCITPRAPTSRAAAVRAGRTTA